MPLRLDIAVPLLAIGVHVATGVGLLALDVHNVRIRRYVGFAALLTLWLVTLVLRVAEPSDAMTSLSNGVAHLLPLAYVLFVLSVRHGDRPPRARSWAIALGGLALLPISVARVAWTIAPVVVYHAALWTTGAVLMMRASSVLPREGRGESAGDRRGRRLVSAALVAAVLLNALFLVVDRQGTVPVLIPTLVSVVQLLVLIGAQRYQLYGLTRRAERAGAERAGALARDAAELERLALLGELGAMVAHEVRNPLTGIRSLAQRLTSDAPDDAARRARFAELIVSEVDRLDRFVGSMLALAKRDGAGTRLTREPDAPVDVSRLFDDLQALVASRAARRGVRLAASAGVRTIGAPRGPVAQVLLNLLLNAIEHSPADGAVTLDARRTAEGVRLAVRDEGPGVPDAAREHLFEPFAPGARGSGLGLAVVRRVADAHDWRLRLDDGADGGGGAEFVLLIPNAAAVS